MSKETLRKQYEERIRESSNGFIHKDSSSSLGKRTEWRDEISLEHIRHAFIEQYDGSGLIPCFLITNAYYYKEYDREVVVRNNERMNRVVNDFFNQYDRENKRIYIDHFIERYEDSYDDEGSRKSPVLNTITGEYELDWCNREKKQGSFHSHHLVSCIPDEIIIQPGKRVMNGINSVYGGNGLPAYLRDEERIEEVKCDLLDYALRKRCEFIGNSEKSLDVRPIDPRRSFDGYSGWKGAVAYVTKNMTSVDKIVQIYDGRNSNILKE